MNLIKQKKHYTNKNGEEKPAYIFYLSVNNFIVSIRPSFYEDARILKGLATIEMDENGKVINSNCSNYK